jgi:hypothetical protein
MKRLPCRVIHAIKMTRDRSCFNSVRPLDTSEPYGGPNMPVDGNMAILSPISIDISCADNGGL